MTGWVRADATGDSTGSARPVDPRDHQRARSPRRSTARCCGGFVDLRSESPEPATALEPVELPELDNGPHFFYGLQWWFFGVLAIFGFVYLVYDELRGGRASARGPLARRPAGAMPARKTGAPDSPQTDATAACRGTASAGRPPATRHHAAGVTSRAGTGCGGGSA